MSDKDIILKAENISKQYRLGVIGTGTISHDLNRWWQKVRGKEDPFLKIGESNDRATKGESDYVWALKDVNFEVERGEVLGIIGKNGAGKSTLLKILSRVTGPTTGSIKSAGRMASLLEVGTGFHPELTGKENVFLNGAILGMTKSEINTKLSEIVEFSGCERYIDTPVKRYSSGMKVRLAFAVAAFLEPDILVVDEVLAVGDAEFQKKAIGKMQDISKSGGRTVLFVSHNMAAVSELCSRGLVIDNGEVSFDGNINEAVSLYLNSESYDSAHINFKDGKKYYRVGTHKFLHLNSFMIFNHLGIVSKELFLGKNFSVHIEFESKTDISNLEIGIAISNYSGVNLGTYVSNWNSFDIDYKRGVYKIKVDIPKMYLSPGSYMFGVWIKKQGEPVDDQYVNFLNFTVLDSDFNGNKTNLIGYTPFNLTLDSKWSLIQ